MKSFIDTEMLNYDKLKSDFLVDHHDHDHHDELTEEQIKSTIANQLKYEYIIQNQMRYLDTYFSNTQSLVNTNVLACDNGGFENDFLHYEGFTSTYIEGSNTCIPLDGSGNPSIFIPVTMPLTHGIEIVNSGIDPMIDIQKTRFGNKALKLNSEFSHNSSDICRPNFGIDRVTKTFKVTEETRDLTIWYAVAIENPTGHVNQQPYLNISCDRDPDNELCFDADLIRCDSIYANSCSVNHKIDVLDWTCHRFKIPKEYIDSIATLTLEIGDCGQGAHFGYAYFDGLCEECTGSALGTNLLNKNHDGSIIGIDYKSCDGTLATVCGSYIPPSICGEWEVGEVNVPGYDIYNVVIDTVNNTYCFDFHIDNFKDESCIDIYSQLLFQDSTFQLPFILSNDVEICKDLYESNIVQHTISSCYTNGTDDYLSDDYYYVDLYLADTEGSDWTLSRKLVNPYDGESGIHAIDDGTGDIYITLGPFLIQEGPWGLIIEFEECTFEEYIEPPVCDIPCQELADYDISNVRCNGNTWSFDIEFHGQWNGIILFDYQSYSFNSIISINGLSDFDSCLNYEILYLPAQSSENPCKSKIEICPPIPCDGDGDPNCDLNVYIKDVFKCDKDNGTFDVEFDISYPISPMPQQLCYSQDNGNSWNVTYGGYPVISYPDGGVATIFKLCPLNTSCEDCMSDCKKIINIPDYDCDEEIIKDPKSRSIVDDQEDKAISEYKVYPQPFENRFYIVSGQRRSDYIIYNLNGKEVHRGAVEKGTNDIRLDQPAGVYILTIKDADDEVHNFKIIKM